MPKRLHQLLPNAGLDPPPSCRNHKDEGPFRTQQDYRDEDRRGKAMIKQLMQVASALAGYYFTIYTGCL